MTNNEYLKKFKEYMEENERSEITIKSYMGDLRHFLGFIGKDIREVKTLDVKQYKDELKGNKLKVQSINRKLVSVKQLLDFLNDEYELGITAKVKQEKVQRQYSLKDEELMTDNDFTKLIEAVGDDIRTKAIFETMAYTGMRVSEMLQMRIDHVGLEVIEDIKGKGGKYRDIYTNHDNLQETLRQYLKVRKQPYSSATKALFVGERGPLTRQTVHHLMKQYAEKAGIPLKKAHAHNLRHLFGLVLAKNGEPIESIAKYMGHTSIDVTKIYLEKPQSHYKNRIKSINFGY